MIRDLLDYYRLPTDSFDTLSPTIDSPSGENGFFEFGDTNICYGRNRGGVSANVADAGKFDASKDVRAEGNGLRLPFDFTEVIENLRRERYRRNMNADRKSFSASKTVRQIYYLVREWLPVWFRRQLQIIYLRRWKELRFPAWPVDFTVDNLHEELLRLLMEKSGTKKVPFIWFWPEGASGCLIMTHDVETTAGRDFTPSVDGSRCFLRNKRFVPSCAGRALRSPGRICTANSGPRM